MSTSGVNTFNLTSDQLVTAALRKIAVLGDGQSPSSTQLSNGTQALNVMLKMFQAKGMPLWAISDTIVPLTATRVYTLNPAPLKVIQAMIEDTSSSIELNPKTHIDYNRLGNLDSVGQPNSYWYDTMGTLHLWPTPDANSIANKTVRVIGQRKIYDMVNGTDNLDFPVYWHEAVIYGLAFRLSGEYGVPLMDRQELAKEAEYFLQEALSFGTEEGSLFLQPNWSSSP